MNASAWSAPLELLPHGPAACCIDAIEAFTPGTDVRAIWRVHAQNVLFDAGRGGVPAWAGIEIMAQCAGLYLGLSRPPMPSGAAPESGYLVGVRRFRAGQPLFPAGSELRIEAACEAASGGELGAFKCRILCGGREGARARLMLWRGRHYPGAT